MSIGRFKTNGHDYDEYPGNVLVDTQNIYFTRKITHMAEQEVIKHTKKIRKLWNNKELSFGHRMKEFIYEIIIIVFAVSVSIWFHDKNVKKHERKEEKEFLIGLRQDLKMDIIEMEEDKKSFFSSKKAFEYVTSAKLGEPLNRDSLKNHAIWMFNNTSLVPNSGRFEGFKSSGKFGIIENKKLQNTIMDLYQENIPSLIVSTDTYNRNKEKLMDFLYKNRKRLTDSTTNINVILASDEAYNICSSLIYIDQIIERYNVCIDNMKEIIKEIESEYGK